ncbi:MAG: DUF4331 family protein [Gemmatimonadales bacterium]
MKAYTLLGTVALVAATACGDSPFQPSDQTFTQVDFMGRPAISTVFLPSAQKDPYNLSIPAQHRAGYKANVTGFLMTVAGYTQPDADALADVLLPDILTVDLSQPTAYLNGRGPADDVVTASLTLVFGPGTPVSDDNVDTNDKTLPTTFPYLATPHVQ